jgi:hypothetical protein
MRVRGAHVSNCERVTFHAAGCAIIAPQGVVPAYAGRAAAAAAAAARAAAARAPAKRAPTNSAAAALAAAREAPAAAREAALPPLVAALLGGTSGQHSGHGWALLRALQVGRRSAGGDLQEEGI